MGLKFARVSSEKVVLGLGAMPTSDHDLTIAAVARVTDDSNFLAIFFAGADTTHRFGYSRSSTSSLESANFGGGSTAPTITLTQANGYSLLAVSKAAGATKPRFHKVALTARTASHEDAAANNSAYGSPVATRCQIGCVSNNTNFYEGEIQVVGVWNVVLDDQQIENLAYSPAAWYLPSLVGMWILDEETTAQLIYDITGGGANESSRVGTAVGTLSVMSRPYRPPQPLMMV